MVVTMPRVVKVMPKVVPTNPEDKALAVKVVEDSLGLGRAKTSWKAKVLARTLLARRLKRGRSRVNPHEMYLHKRSVKDLRQHGQLSAVIGGRTRQAQLLFEQTDQHYDIERKLGRLSRSLRSLVSNARVKVERLRFLQRRLSDLRGSSGLVRVIGAEETVAKHMAAVMRDERSTEIFRTCCVCSKRVLAYLIDDHQEFCQARDRLFLARAYEANNASQGGGSNSSSITAPGLPTPEIECEVCHRRFPGNKVPDKHVRRCQELQAIRAREAARNGAAVVVVETVPYPPRELTLAKAGPNNMRLKWRPPSVDGNSPVTDYEVSFARKLVTKVGRRTLVDVECQGPILTSRWCMVDPVAHTGTLIEGLKGESEYIDLKVRARNRVGWSEYAELGHSVVTGKCGGPSQVPNLAIAKPVTTTSIALSWGEPHDDGGREVKDYEVYYLEMTARPPTSLSSPSSANSSQGGKSVVEPREVRCRLGRAATSCVLTKLSPNTDYFDITVTGVNEGGYLGVPAVISYVRTRMHDYKRRLQQELERAQSLASTYMESTFFTTLPRREPRLFYIKRLQDEIARQEGVDEEELEKELEDEEAKALELAKKKPLPQEDEAERQLKAQQDLIVPKYNTRKREFQYRLRYLALELEQVEEARIQALADRSRLSHEMMGLQARVIELRSELDRVVTFKGEWVNSAIVHGSDQRWAKDVLIAELRREEDIAAEKIMSAKLETHHGFEVERESVSLKAKKTQDLRTRKAAYQVFEANAQRAFRNAGVKADRPVDMRKMLDAWITLVHNNRYMRLKVGETLCGLKRRLQMAAWFKWTTGKHLFEEEEGGGEEEEQVGKGSQLLHTAHMQRKELVERLGDVAVELCGALQTTALSAYPRHLQTAMMANPHFALTEFHKECKALERKMVHTMEGDGFYHSGDYHTAITCYDKEIMEVRREALMKGGVGIDIKALALAYGRKGRAHLALRSWDEAILSFDCQHLLGLELDDHAELAHAFVGMAEGYYEVGDYQRAVELYKSGRNKFTRLGDVLSEAMTYRGLQRCYQAMHVPSIANSFKEQSDAIVQELPNRLGGGYKLLERLRLELIGASAQASSVVQLALVSGLCLRLRRQVEQIRRRIKDTEADKKKVQAQLEEVTERLRLVRVDMAAAKDFTDNTFLTRCLGGGEEEAYDIEEFRIRIVDKKYELEGLLATVQQKLKTTEGDIKNMHDEVRGMGEDLQVEQGKLVQQINRSRLVRQVAFNAANTTAYEVSGRVSGGVEAVVASEGSNLLLFHLGTGRLLHIFQGDEPGRHLGEAEGHVGTITSLFYYKHTAYSGSIDTTIMVWDTRKQQRVRVLRGHQSTVTCLAADHVKLVSGSADTQVCIWDVTTGELRVTLSGHRRSVLCVSLAMERFVTGGAEGDVRIWDVHMSERSKGPSDGITGYLVRRVRCVKRLRGRGVGLTCVGFNKMEVLAGTRDGRILVWWISTGDIMRDIKPHDGPVRCMAFDATKVITGGIDKTVGVCDLVTGDVLQRLRGHTNAVQDICFDATKILTGSADCTLRYWRWGKDEGGRKDRNHIFEAGDSLAKVAKMYNISIADLCKWNGITDPRQVTVGQKLIVAKADPSKPTNAEEQAEARRLRAKVRAGKILAAAGIRDLDKEAEQRDRRRELRQILRQRTEMSRGSMNERMHRALAENDDAEFVYLEAEGHKYEGNFYSIGHRISGKAPPPHSVRSAARRSQEAARSGVDALISAMTAPEYTPDEQKMADEVGMALINGSIRWLAFQVGLEVMAETGWACSMIDRMLNVRELQPTAPRKRKLPARKGRGRGKRARTREGGADVLVLEDEEGEEQDIIGTQRIEATVAASQLPPESGAVAEAAEESAGGGMVQDDVVPFVERESERERAGTVGNMADDLSSLGSPRPPSKAINGTSRGSVDRFMATPRSSRLSVDTTGHAFGAHSFDEERPSVGSPMGFVGMQGGPQMGMSHSHRYLLSQSRRNLSHSHDDHFSASSRLIVDPTGSLDGDRLSVGSPRPVGGVRRHPQSSPSHRNRQDQFAASSRLTVDPTESLDEDRPSVGSPRPVGGVRDYAQSSLSHHNRHAPSQSWRNLSSSNDRFNASSRLSGDPRASSLDEDRPSVGSPTGFVGKHTNEPGWLSQSGWIGRSGKRLNAYPGSPESGVTGASEGWEDAVPGESEAPRAREDGVLLSRRESMASLRMDAYGRRSSFASVGVSSDAAAVFVPDSLPFLSLTAQLGGSGSHKTLPSAPEPVVEATPQVVEEAPVEKEMGKQKAPKGVALDFNRLKEIKKERVAAASAEMLMARMITPADRDRKPTDEERIVAKYRNAPRHDRVGAGGIMGRMKRNAVVVRQIDHELAEVRRGEESVV